MRYYRLGVAAIASEIELSGLPATQPVGNPLITVRRGSTTELQLAWEHAPAAEWDCAPDWAEITSWRSADGAWRRLRYEYRGHYADFAIRSDGSEVAVDAGAGEDDAEVANLIEGAILGRAMRLAGLPCLHANALSHDGRAVLLMGSSGAGKSSLGWALVQQGCRLVADDMVALSADEVKVYVHPGRSRLRLWPDAVQSLAVDPALAGALFPTATELAKLGLRATDAQERSPVHLHGIYRLQPRARDLDEPVVAEIQASEALAMLAASLHGMIDPGREARRRELAVQAQIVATVPVRSLTLPDDLDVLPQVAQRLRDRLFA